MRASRDECRQGNLAPESGTRPLGLRGRVIRGKDGRTHMIGFPPGYHPAWIRRRKFDPRSLASGGRHSSPRIRDSIKSRKEEKPGGREIDGVVRRPADPSEGLSSAGG